MDIGYVGAFLGGLLSLLSPCSVMLLPAFFAYAFTSTSKLMSRTAIFTAGLLVTLVPLGVFSGVFGSLIGRNRGTLITVVSVVIIVVGLIQLAGIPLPGLKLTASARAERTSALSVFMLGAVYAVAGVCTGPILGSVLMVASLGGSPVYGGLLLSVYALGMVMPLAILTLLWKRLGNGLTTWLRPRTITIGRWENSWVSVITGVLSIALGVLLLASDGTTELGGLVSVGTQFTLESKVSAFASGISDVAFIAVALLVAAAVALWIKMAKHKKNAPLAGMLYPSAMRPSNSVSTSSDSISPDSSAAPSASAIPDEPEANEPNGD